MQLGEKLKEARLEKDLTLDDLQKETKIQKRYLESLERNDWSVLPGQFYVRAFVREYAEAVGLNGEELLEEHKEELPSTSTQNYDYVTPSRSSRTSSGGGSNSLFNFLPKMLVVLLIVAIIFAIYYAVINLLDPGASEPDEGMGNEEVITAPDEDENEENNQEQEQEQEETTETEEQEEEEPEESTTQINVASADESDVTTVYEVSNVDQLNLSLETTNENWLRVEGDERHFDGMLTPDNSPIEFELEENEVYLNLGSTEGLTIYVNGEELEYEFHPDDNNRYVRQHIYIELVEE
ncbi:helix-turn-helix domain-containing protein [Piscibacillus sp. B03]|uniref:helix-turn-helix domain-containing protein n=1 Tax=Piscibacillus sp. B03 TaxID=3457430 RepID=UPI003FCDAD32